MFHELARSVHEPIDVLNVMIHFAHWNIAVCEHVGFTGDDVGCILAVVIFAVTQNVVSNAFDDCGRKCFFWCVAETLRVNVCAFDFTALFVAANHFANHDGVL